MFNIKSYLIDKHGARWAAWKAEKNTELTMPCPSCNRDDEHFNFNVKIKRGGCFSCMYECDDIILVMKLEGITHRQAEQIVKYGYDGTNKIQAAINLLSMKEQVQVSESENKHQNSELPEDFELMVDSLRDQQVIIPTVFAARNYPISTIEKLKIGFSRSHARIIFPILCDGKRSWVARRIHDWQDKKFKNPPGSKHSQLLYNYDNIPQNVDVLMVVEGATDSARLDSYGYYVVGTFGKKISVKYQVNLIFRLNPKEVVSIFDGEAIKQNMKAFDKLSMRMNSSYALLPKKPNSDKYYDPDDCPKSMFDQCVENRARSSKIDNAINILTHLL